MKRCIPQLLLILAAFLPSAASAQLWVESLTNTNLTFAFRGVDSLGVMAQEDQGAGARLSFNFDALAKTIRIDVTNLSGGWRTVGGAGGEENVFFGAGTLNGFGFDTAPSNLTANAFGAWGNSAFNAAGVGGTDWVNFSLNQNFNLNGGGRSQPYYMDIGTHSSGSVHAGLAAGRGASFLFKFDTSEFDSDLFNPIDFFFNDLDSSMWDMSFRFQQTSGLYNTHRCTYHCNCGDNGSDKVAIAFHLEEDLQVPEPSTYGLIGAGALLVLVLRRRLRR